MHVLKAGAQTTTKCNRAGLLTPLDLLAWHQAH